jgi:hypothetical protein
MNTRIIIFLVAAAILFTVLVPSVLVIAAVLLLITPALLAAHRPIDAVAIAQSLALPPPASELSLIRRSPREEPCP